MVKECMQKLDEMRKQTNCTIDELIEYALDMFKNSKEYAELVLFNKKPN